MPATVLIKDSATCLDILLQLGLRANRIGSNWCSLKECYPLPSLLISSELWIVICDFSRLFLKLFIYLRMISLWYNSFTPHSPTIIDSGIPSLNNFLDNQRFLLSAPSFLYFKHLYNQPFYNDRHTFPCLFLFN